MLMSSSSVRTERAWRPGPERPRGRQQPEPLMIAGLELPEACARVAVAEPDLHGSVSTGLNEVDAHAVTPSASSVTGWGTNPAGVSTPWR